MLGTVINVLVRKEGRSAYGFIVADGDKEEDPSARFYFDSRGCLDDPSELTKLSGARVSFDVRPGRGPKPFAVNVRVLAPNTEKGIVTGYSNGKQVFGFVQDGWGTDYFFSPALTANFSELRKGDRVSFEVSRRRGRPAARNVNKIK